MNIDHTLVFETCNHLRLESVVLISVAQASVLVKAHRKDSVFLVEQETVINAPTHGLKLRDVLCVDLLVGFIGINKCFEVDTVFFVLYFELHIKWFKLVLDTLVEAQFSPRNPTPHPKSAIFGESSRVVGSSPDHFNLLVGLIAALEVQLGGVIEMNEFLTDSKLTLQPFSEDEDFSSPV